MADNPTALNYYDPDGDKRVVYKEGLNVGYRYYDKAKVKPMFPFGFGMSYTSFEYSDLVISGGENNQYVVSFKIKNIGKYDGAESAQVYVHQKNSPVERPERNSKALAKFFLRKAKPKRLVSLWTQVLFRITKPTRKPLAMMLVFLKLLLVLHHKIYDCVLRLL